MWRRAGRQRRLYDGLVVQLYHSYLIRSWQESRANDPEVRWRGEVESVQTGQKWRFDNLNNLLAFIRTQVDTLASDVSESDGGL
jgi:hypothetical protein